MVSQRRPGSNEYFWEEQDQTTRLPVEPDALFSLGLSFNDGRQQVVNFLYEADRGSMSMADMLRKFRAYYHFIKRQQKHKEAFGIHPVRAVLVETTNEQRARKLMELVSSPAVIGYSQRSALFWFSVSPLFTRTASAANGASVPEYLLNPGLVLARIWALPDLSMIGLTELENPSQLQPQPARAV